LGLFDKFKKSTPAPAAGSGDSGAPIGGESHEHDPRKARRFFEHAKTVADARNYDYAIECYINGLKHDPESLKHHEELRDVAMRRKVGGGKPPGMMEKLKLQNTGKTAVEKMLNAEMIWSKDPLDSSAALLVMEGAVKANLGEVAYWVGQFILGSQVQKKPDKKTYIKLKDLYSEIGAWDKAVEAMRQVVATDPGNMALLQELKNLEAEKTIMDANYAKEGGFRSSIKDADKQAAAQMEQSISQQDAAVEANIVNARKLHEENPDDLDRVVKLVNALLVKEQDETEADAIRLLDTAHQKSGQYRFKVRIGDIKMRQLKRHLRNAKLDAQRQTDPKAQQAAHDRLRQLADEQLRFELKEFTERVKNYPTDMRVRHELGLRQFAVGDNDAAITSFQEAKADPKVRPWAMRYLGEAFLRKEWADEAMDTFRAAIEIHPLTDDRLALELRYELTRALELKGRKERDAAAIAEAVKVASQIAQTDFNYRDIRQVVDRLRKFADELRGGAPA
jgi:tetratricopeptide (TPR) repeat protein